MKISRINGSRVRIWHFALQSGGGASSGLDLSTFCRGALFHNALTGHPRKQGTSSPAFKYSSTPAVSPLWCAGKTSSADSPAPKVRKNLN